jgi:signal transduction histidine kinase/CheY-like chemotaxis protein
MSVDQFEIRRSALAFTLSQARMTVATMFLVVGMVAWLGWQTGAVVPVAVFVAMGVVNGAWRLQVLRHLGDPAALDEAGVRQLELQIQANMLFGGVMWTFATFTLYPRMDLNAASLYVINQVATITFAAFFMSTVGRGFMLFALPMTISGVVVNLGLDRPGSLPLAGLIGIYTVVMMRATDRFKDITLLAFRRGFEAQQTNAELRQAMAAAEAAGRAKTRFLATMSHELRTPLNGLLGALELLSRAPLEAPQRRLVGIAHSSGSGLLAVLNDVLDYAKFDADQVALRLQPVDLRALVDSVVALFSAPAHAQGLTLHGEVSPEVPAWVSADSQRLRQVLLNLVGNAIKFTDRGRVTIAVRRVDSGLCFEIVDSGIGIAPDDRAHLFEPFHQVHEGSDRSHGGSGLGLAISQRLVLAMGGKIEVESVAGVGSTFAFTLALADAAAPPPRSEAGEPAFPATFPGPPARVLVVEDNEVNRVLAAELLALIGVDVILANDGEQALERLRQGGIDLVLMDCQMPTLDGYEATRRWRALEHAGGRGERLPVVALTANVMPEDFELAMAAGMDDVLGKPYTIDQLRGVLQRWLPALQARTRPVA